VKKQGELVQLSTQDVSTAFLSTTSLVVSQKFEKDHFTVLRDIRKLEDDLNSSLSVKELGEYKVVCTSYTDVQNKDRTSYLMNEEFFTMLVMGYRTKKAFKFKHDFIQAFKFMKNELQARSETRHIGVIARNTMTSSISDNVKEGNFKKYSYGNYTKLIYKYVLGATVKKYKETHGITGNLRNFLSIEDLLEIQKVESDIAAILEFSKAKNDKDVYQEIKTYLNNKYRKQIK